MSMMNIPNDNKGYHIALYFLVVGLFVAGFIALELKHGPADKTVDKNAIVGTARPDAALPPITEPTAASQAAAQQATWAGVWNYLWPPVATPAARTATVLPPRVASNDVMADIVSRIPDKRTRISFYLHDTLDRESLTFTQQVIANLRRLGYMNVAWGGAIMGGGAKEKYFGYNVLPGNVVGITVYKNVASGT